MKKILLLAIILALGVFIYLKIEAAGDPKSYFNQTTRYTLAKYASLRTILGLHNPGDARAEYVLSSKPIYIVWFKPLTEELDPTLLDRFANLVGSYTGRKVELIKGGRLDDITVPYENLGTYKFNSGAGLGSTPILVFFTTDYSTRKANEFSTTYLESGIVISLSAHKKLLGSGNRNLQSYLLSSLLHEFGRQVGLEDNSTLKCVMNSQKGPNGEALRFSAISPPEDFCEKEKIQIKAIKSGLSN